MTDGSREGGARRWWTKGEMTAGEGSNHAAQLFLSVYSSLPPTPSRRLSTTTLTRNSRSSATGPVTLTYALSCALTSGASPCFSSPAPPFQASIHQIQPTRPLKNGHLSPSTPGTHVRRGRQHPSFRFLRRDASYHGVALKTEKRNHVVVSATPCGVAVPR
jgi:hypothetical protein